METLDHEKFQGIKELAEITQGISKGRALLASLKAEEETYLEEREQKAVQRLQDALTASEDLIKQIGANHSELVGYHQDINNFVEALGSLIQSVKDCAQVLHEATVELERKVATHEATVETFMTQSRQENALIQGKREGLAVETANLNIRATRVADDEGRLKRAFERIKNVK